MDALFIWKDIFFSDLINSLQLHFLMMSNAKTIENFYFGKNIS